MKLSDYIGETSSYDKKQMLERNDPLSWLKSVSAFANCFGGKLLFGVSDDGELVGLADAETDAEKMSEIIKNSMDPIPPVKLVFHEEEGKRFIILEVMAGNETPYYTLVKGHRDAYTRIGNESVKATSIQLKRLVLQGENRSWDSLVNKHKRRDFSFEVLRAMYFEKRKHSFEDSDFESFGLMDADGYLTNAGALLADRSPIRHSRVFCTRWNGLTKAHGLLEALDDEEFEGGLVWLLNSSLGFIARNTKMRWRKTSQGRVEYPEYPEDAYREALINAFIHRDYLVIGSEVHVDIFDNRLEIYSPGGMPGGKLVQDVDVLNIPSERRNPVIADVFQRLELMERRGSGFKKILDAYRFSPNYREDRNPALNSTPYAFFVTLPNLNYGLTIKELIGAETLDHRNSDGRVVDKTVDKVVDKTVDKASNSMLSSIHRKVLYAIMKDNGVTQQRLAELLKIGKTSVQNHISFLKNNGFIKRIGANKNGHWEVIR